ncbi:small multi-drug export protein [Aureibacillus halotolerans]|uniref:Putative small multi-drug export protein n=1 Tax=Aureibacillus halotolerans TaxID=1508390 RepID=A0A4R6U4N4_9BACI|nr:small multi-drug export protein [Aureibacillus halotolerans]TDQ41121.1 putative small multi-drug export protein [Aureibacillus halotolerans]
MLHELQETYFNVFPGLEGNIFLQLLCLFVLSLIPFFEAHGAIPFGVILGTPTIPVVITAAAGNWLSVMAFIWGVSKLRSKMAKKKQKKKEPSKRAIKARGYFEKYGVPGVSLAGIILGFHLAAGIPLAAGVNKSYVSLWITISIILGSILVGVLAAFGVNLLH